MKLTCLESLLPSVEVKVHDLLERRTGEENVQGLTLVDERSSGSSQVNDMLLRNFPDGSVEFLEIIWDFLDTLNGSIHGHKLVSYNSSPKVLFEVKIGSRVR